jgi:hypothetical protein
MSRKTLILSLAIAVFAALPAVAGEIVHFKDGTTMGVESHLSRDGVVRVNLGAQSFMAFPMDRIARIVTTEGRVLLDENNASANQMLARPRAVASTINGGKSARQRRGSWEGELSNTETDTSRGVDKNGLAVFLPYGSGAASNKRGVGAVGRRELLNAAPVSSKKSGIIGTRQLGSRHILPAGKANTPATRPMPMGLTARQTPNAPAKKK